jgi:hypothetical protein
MPGSALVPESIDFFRDNHYYLCMGDMSQRESVQCAECGQYIDPFRGYVCKSCRRRPLCREHMDPKMRGICQKCANRTRRKQLGDLKAGAKGMKSFLRFLEFLFLVFAVLFAAQRLVPDAIPAYIAQNVAFKYIYIPGILSMVGFVVVYFLYLGQKRAVSELEDELKVLPSLVPKFR